MRIDNALPAFYTQIPQNTAIERYSVPEDPQRMGALSRPGVIVDISPEGWAAYERNKAPEELGAAGKSAILGPKECETCKNRKYKDSSDDPSVSFQTPTHISPEQSASMVMTHEGEHVSHEQAKAEQEGRRVISQTVTLQTSICPECGRIYVSGGTTRTVTAKNSSNETPIGKSEN